jgi:hypothetical protein
MEDKVITARTRGMSEFTWRHLVRTYGEEFAEICILPDAGGQARPCARMTGRSIVFRMRARGRARPPRIAAARN